MKFSILFRITFAIIIIIIFNFHLKKQTISTVQLTRRIIGMVGCQESKCSSSWLSIITFAIHLVIRLAHYYLVNARFHSVFRM